MGLGQFTGARGNYEYTADDGSLYLISTDRTLGDISGAKLVLATSGSDAVSPPKRFRPRIVYWQGELNSKIVRKKIICDIDSTLYKNNKSVSLEIDNVDGFTTGRRGEKFSYLKLSQDENGIIPGDGVS
jgi:hypothetical protein